MSRIGDLIPLFELRPRLCPVIDRGCPLSGGSLVLRQGPHGDFLGCSDYPECDYVEKVVG